MNLTIKFRIFNFLPFSLKLNNLHRYLTYLLTETSFDFRGFMPSYRTEDQMAEPSVRVDKNREDRDNQPERTQRFGISAYGGSGQVRSIYIRSRLITVND